MSIFNFTYNNVATEVNVEEMAIKIPEPNFSKKRVYKVESIALDPSNKQILVNTSSYFEENGLIENRSYKKDPVPRRYNNDNLTSLGIGMYDFFAGLVNQSVDIGFIFERAALNNQLEEMLDVYGEQVPCFNAYADWIYFTPIEASVSSVLTSAEPDPNEYTITASVVTAGTYEYKLELSDNTLIQDWSGTNEFTNVVPGEYLVYVRSTVDTGQKVFTLTLD